MDLDGDHYRRPGDRARFWVPGGRIDVTLTPQGTLQVYGIADMNPRTHMDGLAVRASSQNLLLVSLDEAPE